MGSKSISDILLQVQILVISLHTTIQATLVDLQSKCTNENLSYACSFIIQNVASNIVERAQAGLQLATHKCLPQDK